MILDVMGFSGGLIQKDSGNNITHVVIQWHVLTLRTF